MPFSHGKDGGFSIEDSSTSMRNISSYLNNVDFSRMADTAETTTFNTSQHQKTYVPGNKDATFSLSGLVDPTVDGYLTGIIGLEKGYSYYANTTDATDTTFIRYSGNAILTDYSPSTPIDGANAFTATLQNTGSITRSTAST